MKNLKDFTDAMHAAARENPSVWDSHSDLGVVNHASDTMDSIARAYDLSNTIDMGKHAIHLALIAAEIARRVK